MKRTPLHPEHVALGARMTPFAGWDMPLQFTSIMDEHMAVRERCGMFDVSHMGDLVVRGEGASEAVDALVTNDVAGAAVGRCVYCHILEEDGTIMDDAIVTRLGGDEFLIVPNAATASGISRWMEGHLRGQEFHDLSDTLATVAVQGPAAAAAVGELTTADLSGIGPFRAAFARLDVPAGVGAPTTALFDGREGLAGEGVPALLSRTGYTGEDGFEIVCENADAVAVWRALLELRGRHGLVPVGLGARDTLRLEKGLLLSGTDFDGSQTPLQTGPRWVVKWDREFVGKRALEEQRASGGYPVLAGIVLKDRGVPRHGYGIVADSEVVGGVTSGTLSPVLRKGIALGYLPEDKAAPGTGLGIRIRDGLAAAEVVETPFVKRVTR